MSKLRKSTKKYREKAYHLQKGLCYYCKQPMLLSVNELSFCSLYKVSKNQAHQLSCTAEHLMAHSKGGDTDYKNIVAACLFCNQKRHQRKNEVSPERYKGLVRNRLNRGKWHTIQIADIH